MKKDTGMKPNAVPALKGERLNAAGTILLIILLISYLTMTLNSSAKLAEQTDVISNHPFEVVISAGDVKLYISEMQIRTERLPRHHADEDRETVRGTLEALNLSLQEPLLHIRELYLGAAEDVTALEAALARLREAQAGYLNFVTPETADAQIEDYGRTHLQPLYEEALRDTEKIIMTAQEKNAGYGRKANSLRQSTLYGSVFFMVLMIAALLATQYVLWLQRKELVYRSKLFDNLSRSIDDAFVIRDAATGEIHYCGLNIDRVLGFSAADEQAVSENISKEDLAEIREAVRDPRFPSPYEKVVEYAKPGGEKRWLSMRFYRTSDMAAPQIITVLSDRTEEVLSRRVLEDAMLNAERANTAKSDFLSRMSHEIRTPLNAIIGMTAIAAASVRDTARVEDCLEKINFSSKHLLMLINDVLDMSKIESNKMIIQEESFDIFQVVNGFVSTVYAQAKAKQIDFAETMDGFGSNAVYIGDSLRLTQILLNLSSNAVKFTPPGGRIRLEVSRIAAKSTVDVISFVLSDTGIGMDQSAVERIFKPFEQADASISKRFGGTGLGMSITKNLVTLMNGKIRVSSAPGAGTVCTVDLPFRRGTDSVNEPDFGSRGLCALVVDDEQQVCGQTACLLEKIKIRAEWKLSGADAAERVREMHRDGHDFDLCLIDWKMPGMDGIELTRRIRRDVGEDIPIVMISAYDISEVEKEAREAGVNGFLPKPLYRSSVYSAVQQALEGKRRTAEEAPETDGRPLEGMRLLMAEDNELNQEIAVELLRMCGAEVQCAGDGKEALDLFQASEPGRYDAILMDVQMPVMDGHEAARRIRASGHPMAARIPIIAATANAFSDDISAALAAGMNAHVSKPLDIKQLCRVLLECLRTEKEGDAAG